jgi:ABC-type Na+ efflux pump permease subunit
MRMIELALKDLLQIVHDRKSLFFLVLMPIAFTTFYGYIISGMITDPRLPVGWINADEDGALSLDLFNNLNGSNIIRLIPMSTDQIKRASDQVRDEKLAAAVLVPSDFTIQAMAGEALPVKVTVMPGSPAGTTASNTIQGQ